MGMLFPLPRILFLPLYLVINFSMSFKFNSLSFSQGSWQREGWPDQSPLTEQRTSLVKHTYHNYNVIFVCVTTWCLAQLLNSLEEILFLNLWINYSRRGKLGEMVAIHVSRSGTDGCCDSYLPAVWLSTKHLNSLTLHFSNTKWGWCPTPTPSSDLWWLLRSNEAERWRY